MKKDLHPTELAIAVLSRSVCSVQVGAVLLDEYGVFSWGWNSVGDGFGMHAEHHCISRANRSRLPDAMMFVAARRRKSGNTLTAKPCEDCQKLIKKVPYVFYRNGAGEWVRL